ncbi:alpha-L-fucosidase [Saccharicrinis carchari]|uniref:alpha-L-fucosidase n=1 Tax=Saccharicrinis carchari TaxID=1168039 RepID=A0A521BYK3_SACCC|nr:alpha-L-fucosidase [Saccharicrinis carchari]SMO52135.1 alpha-L-fucosidase [Saccharicrinis carchari]
MKHLFILPLMLFALHITAWAQNPITPSNTIKINEGDTPEDIIRKAAHVVPTPNQYEYKKLEFTGFVHFGPNTFTRMEWGNGMEDPKIFDLQNLDTDQWCRAMKAAGMKLVVFTAKHHDGFVLWQSRYTEHGIMSSPFREGKGDVLKELSASCQKYGLKLGVYLSPADLYQIENPEGLYGNLSKYSMRTIPRAVEGRPFSNKTTFEFEVDDYNEYFLNQLFELLTEYGPVHEVWFDGAHPKRKGGQKYNYPAWKKLIRTLAPEAVIFGREDVRWCGNESGGTRKTEWDIVPLPGDPKQMLKFPDMHGDIGSREKLMDAKYLHYLPAETNTSIREGWFYRDETSQKVRNADDVFDIYERSVGGNSTFLLNIPPNRDGLFSPEDVAVLEETGNRIRETYGNDLLQGATDPAEMLDNDELSFVDASEFNNQLIVELPQTVTVNRFVLMEAIATHSQRIEEHALDAMVEGQWKEIASGTTVGYKKILRFPTVSTDKFRIRILKSRLNATLSKVSAHYYKSRPPQITMSRNATGEVTLAPKADDFGWKSHGIDATGNLNADMEIRYTLDGSTPSKTSAIYDSPIKVKSGEVKARAFSSDQAGSETSVRFGLLKNNWQLVNASSSKEGFEAGKAFDDQASTYWQSDNTSVHPHSVSIDLGTVQSLTGFAYTPQTQHKEGMMELGSIYTSKKGKKWKKVTSFEFGNLINDPVKRTKAFDKPLKTRYIKIVSERGAGGSNSVAVAELDFFVD